MTIEKDETIRKLRDYVLGKLDLPFDNLNDPVKVRKVCVRASRKPPQCGRVILNHEDMVDGIREIVGNIPLRIVQPALGVSMKEEIIDLNDCSVLVSQEGLMSCLLSVFLMFFEKVVLGR